MESLTHPCRRSAVGSVLVVFGRSACQVAPLFLSGPDVRNSPRHGRRYPYGHRPALCLVEAGHDRWQLECGLHPFGKNSPGRGSPIRSRCRPDLCQSRVQEGRYGPAPVWAWSWPDRSVDSLVRIMSPNGRENRVRGLL